MTVYYVRHRMKSKTYPVSIEEQLSLPFPPDPEILQCEFYQFPGFATSSREALVKPAESCLGVGRGSAVEFSGREVAS